MLEQFLSFLENDIQKNPSSIRAIDFALFARAKNLVSRIEVDLDACVKDEDKA